MPFNESCLVFFWKPRNALMSFLIDIIPYYLCNYVTVRLEGEEVRKIINLQ